MTCNWMCTMLSPTLEPSRVQGTSVLEWPKVSVLYPKPSPITTQNPPTPRPLTLKCFLSPAFITWVFVVRPTNCALSAQDFPPTEKVVRATEGSTTCSKPRLFCFKLNLLRSSCGTVLLVEGTMILVWFSIQINAIFLIWSPPTSHPQWTCATTYFEGFAQSTRPLLYHCCALAFEKTFFV